MSVDLSLDVQRHLARVYAVLATCILASAGSAAALLALVPWEAPSTTIVTCVSIAGLIVGVIAFACTPTECMAVRFFLLMAMCMCGGTFFAFLAELTMDEDPSFIPKTLWVSAVQRLRKGACVSVGNADV
jgi:FtsH-binding integral membrane protein